MQSAGTKHTNKEEFVAKSHVCVLTISSIASLAAVTDNTNTSGTTVVNQDKEEIAGITYNTQTKLVL